MKLGSGLSIGKLNIDQLNQQLASIKISVPTIKVKKKLPADGSTDLDAKKQAFYDWYKQFVQDLDKGSSGGGAKPGGDDSGAGSGGSGGGGSGGGSGGSGGNSGTPASMEAFEKEVLRLVNEYRVENGKDPLHSDARLNDAAESWSKSMATGDFVGHSSPKLTKQQGYDYAAWGENVAAGQKTPEQVVDAWIASPGHRANMLSDKFEDIGIGHYYLANDTGKVNYGHYWTQVFATEADTMMS